jgi:hypothetical protein
LDRLQEELFWCLFERVQLQQVATKYDKLRQFLGRTTVYGKSRQNTTFYNSADFWQPAAGATNMGSGT